MLLRKELMRAARRFRYLILGLFLYAGFCAAGGFCLAMARYIRLGGH
jgi:hypothetical protein